MIDWLDILISVIISVVIFYLTSLLMRDWYDRRKSLKGLLMLLESQYYLLTTKKDAYPVIKVEEIDTFLNSSNLAGFGYNFQEKFNHYRAYIIIGNKELNEADDVIKSQSEYDKYHKTQTSNNNQLQLAIKFELKNYFIKRKIIKKREQDHIKRQGF